MTPIRLLCVIGLILRIQAHAAPVKIACVGDSITQGSGLGNAAIESYPARLQRLLGTNSIVRNYGVSGRTLLKKGDFPYWNEAFFRQSHDFLPDVVIIQLGTNDSKPQNWRHGTNFVSDYEALITSYLVLTNQPKVFICTPCPVYLAGAYDIRPGVVATNITPAIHDIAERLGLDLIDLHTRMAGHRDWFPDTVHPNSKGMVAMAAVMCDSLAGGPPDGAPPPVGVRKVLTGRVEVSWPSQWRGLIPQSTGVLRGTNTTWSVVDTVIPYGDEAWIRLTNSSAGAPKFFRLWQP